MIMHCVLHSFVKPKVFSYPIVHGVCPLTRCRSSLFSFPTTGFWLGWIVLRLGGSLPPPSGSSSSASYSHPCLFLGIYKHEIREHAITWFGRRSLTSTNYLSTGHPHGVTIRKSSIFTTRFQRFGVAIQFLPGHGTSIPGYTTLWKFMRLRSQSQKHGEYVFIADDRVEIRLTTAIRLHVHVMRDHRHCSTVIGSISLWCQETRWRSPLSSMQSTTFDDISIVLSAIIT
jgi:hypothetical protein